LVGKAYYLCDNGAPTDLDRAIFAHNHADWYAQKVLDQAADYRDVRPLNTSWPDEQATLPDPTGNGGHVTLRMHALYRTLEAAGATTGGATCWDPHVHNPESDHPRGNACDIFYNLDRSRSCRHPVVDCR
jgi:hypothetical protein